MGTTADSNPNNLSQKSSLSSSSSSSSRMSQTAQQSLSKKPTYQKVGKTSLKKIKFHSKSCEDASKQERVFNKLDTKNPQHAHKIQQRRKVIGKGKNTVGYDIYCSKVPKEKRQKRSMVTPSTPDHTLDIPNKKWLGMIKSWRIALHKYDPVDLQQSFVAAQDAAVTAEQQQHQKEGERKSPNDPTLSVKEKELANSGLLNLVDVTNNDDSLSQFLSSKSTTTTTCTDNNDDMVMESMPTAAAGDSIEGDLDDVSFCDSDDDLL